MSKAVRVSSPFYLQRDWRAPLTIALSVVFGLAIALMPLSFTLMGLGAAVLGLSLIAGVYPAIAWALIIAPLRAIIEIRAPGLIPGDMILVAVALIAAGWVISRTLSRRSLVKFHFSPVLLGVGGFAATGALSLFGASSPTLWLSDWMKWVFVIALILLTLNLYRWEWLAYALALAGAANAVLGVYVYFGGSGVEHFAINSLNFRAFGTFEQPNPFGGFMGVLTPFLGALAIGGLVRAWATWRAQRIVSLITLSQVIFFGGCATLTAAALIFSWSRGAWLALAVALIITAVTLPRQSRYGVYIFVLIAGLGGMLWASGRLPVSITERVASSFTDLLSANDVRGVDVTPENYAAIERFAHWQAAIEMARLSPWIGVGLGNYEAAYPTVRLLAWEFPLGHAHNYYLNVLAETGIIGLIMYLAMWVTIIRVTWRARRHPDPLSSAAAAGLLGTWAYIAVHSLTDQLYVNAVFLHVGVLIGIAALLERQTWKYNRLRL